MFPNPLMQVHLTQVILLQLQQLRKQLRHQRKQLNQQLLNNKLRHQLHQALLLLVLLLLVVAGLVDRVAEATEVDTDG